MYETISKQEIRILFRIGCKFFPPTLSLPEATFSLEHDGMHVKYEDEEERVITAIFSRETVNALLEWLAKEQQNWLEQGSDPSYQFTPSLAFCKYCRINVAHTLRTHLLQVGQEMREIGRK